MRVVLVSGEEDELANPRGLPRVQQVVEHSVKRLLAERRVSGKAALGLDVDALFPRGSQQHGKLGREVAGESLDDYGVTPQRHVRTVLLARSDGNDHSRISLDERRDLRGSHPFYSARLRSRRDRGLNVDGRGCWCGGGLTHFN